MATLTDTDLTRVSTDAAEKFIDAYYTALNGARETITTYYVPSNVLASGKTLPQITINGEVVTDAAALQERFKTQMPWTHYEPQSLNAHVLNPSITPLDAKAGKKERERNISVLVQVSGYVRLIERKDGPMRGFSETMVLVPNTEEAGGKGTGKTGQGRQWVIQSQTFRFVV